MKFTREDARKMAPGTQRFLRVENRAEVASIRATLTQLANEGLSFTTIADYESMVLVVKKKK